VGSVFVFARNAATPPPQLGEHTRQVLGDLGMEEEELKQLEEAGVIKTRDL
jgi:crotonobetainyl-CoA:carnitine CoA-transferase CaiB-like acyl-CoA transferase